MSLHNLPKLGSKRRSAKRVGRGYGSGKGGHTTGRGVKGQKVRNRVRPGFAGGESSYVVRAPRPRGFASRKSKPLLISLADLNRFRSGSTVTPKMLAEAGILSEIPDPQPGIKILAGGKLEKKISVKGIPVSAGARKAIEDAGGEVIGP